MGYAYSLVGVYCGLLHWRVLEWQHDCRLLTDIFNGVSDCRRQARLFVQPVNILLRLSHKTPFNQYSRENSGSLTDTCGAATQRHERNVARR